MSGHPKWQSIDTAPTDGSIIIAVHKDNSGVFLTRYGVFDGNPSKGGWFYVDYSDEASGFDYWLPTYGLPETTD